MFSCFDFEIRAVLETSYGCCIWVEFLDYISNVTINRSQRSRSRSMGFLFVADDQFSPSSERELLGRKRVCAEKDAGQTVELEFVVCYFIS